MSYTSPDPYQRVTDKLLELLEGGTIPWKKGWQSEYQGGPPISWNTKKQYRGSNYFLLRCAPYSSNGWVTFKQAKAMGGNIRKGSKAWPCVFWKFIQGKDKDGKVVIGENGKPKQIPMLKSYSIFNLEQTEGIEIPKAPDWKPLDFEPISRCENVLAAMPNRPQIKHGGSRACYSSSEDLVKMPERETFTGEEEYYETLFHELVHSTGHKARLNRPLGNGFGTPAYAREELIAEIGASLLCGYCHIEQATIENSAAYLQGWMEALKKDKKLFVTAAGKAQKAADFVLNREGLQSLSRAA